MTSRLKAVFRPRSIVVIGASRDPESMSGTLLKNLKHSFPGPLYAVNPRATEVQGVPSYPNVGAVPGDVDLAFIGTPLPYVTDAAEDCINAGVRALVVITAGFSETGNHGRELERRLAKLTDRAAIPLVGPNCMGILNNAPAHPLNGCFSQPSPPTGNVAVGTQSGAMGFVFPDYMRRWRLGVSQMLSTGNKADVGENDLLDHWARDPQCEVIQLYLESFQNPRKFLSLARRISREKPIVVMKAGRTSAGVRAAGSHTAALAGPEAATDGMLKQAGAIRCRALRELFDVTALLATQPLPTGPRVAVLTNAGGPGVVCADALEAAGLQVPELSATLQTELGKILPGHASVRNPVDLVGSTNPEQFRICVQRLLARNETDALVVIYVPRLPGSSAPIAQAIRDATERTPHSPQTVVTVFMESASPPACLATANPPIPAFDFPESAASALAAAVRRRHWLATPPGNVVLPSGFSEREVRLCVERAARVHGPSGGWLAPDEVQRLLASCGLPIPAWQVVKTTDEAVEAARQLGGPVVIKAVDPSIIHKASAGGVALDLRNDNEVRDACERLKERAPELEAFHLQQYLPGDLELMLGIRYDAEFGHLLGCGWGGVHVEQVSRFEVRLHPLTDRDVDDLLHEHIAPQQAPRNVGSAPRTSMADAKSPAAYSAVQDALQRLNHLVSMAPEFDEVDLNPVVVFEQQGRILCVDARFHLRSREAGDGPEKDDDQRHSQPSTTSARN